MKKTYLLFSVFVLSFTNCSKDDSAPTSIPTPVTPIVPANKHIPTCAYFNQIYSAGKTQEYVYFFDLSPAESKDKLYFVAQHIPGTDSLKVISEPQSIETMGKNFPKEITEYPGSGWANQWYTTKGKLITNGSSYYFDATKAVTFLSDTNPQASINIKLPGVSKSGAYYHDVHFYFKKNICYDSNNETGKIEPKQISDFYPPGASYDWVNVNSAYQAALNAVSNEYHFVDFKNWRYFVWKEKYSTPPGGFTTGTVQVSTYKSLDKLVKWPEGWGKK